MADPQDVIVFAGVEIQPDGDGSSRPSRGPRRRFLAVLYRCCHVYGRLYRNAQQTAYVGRCPRCGAPVQALIGNDGTNRRTFEAK